MFTIALNCLEISISQLRRIFAVEKAPNRGPMPTWINDPKLAKQLLNDTGLTPDDLGASFGYDEAKPFFMQPNYW